MPKKSKKSKKRRKKDYSLDYLKYAGSLLGFGVVGIILRKSWVAQAIFTTTFSIYLYWFALRFDKIRKVDLR